MVWSQPVWVGGGGVLGCTYFPPYPDFTPNAQNRKYGHMTTFILNSPLLADQLWWVGHTNYDVWDHFAWHPQKQGCLLRTGEGGGGKKAREWRLDCRYRPKKTGETVDRHQNNGSVKAVSPRHCATTSALCNCCFICPAGQSQGQCPLHCCWGTTRSERSPTFAAQLHLPAHDLFWANLRVQLHLPPLDLTWNPVLYDVCVCLQLWGTHPEGLREPSDTRWVCGGFQAAERWVLHWVQAVRPGSPLYCHHLSFGECQHSYADVFVYLTPTFPQPPFP